MATDLIVANSKILHLATPIDAIDALNKSYVDTPTNNFQLIEQNQCALILICPIKKLNLVTPTNNNDTAIKLHVNGVKQAATLGLYLYEMGHDNKNETKF